MIRHTVLGPTPFAQLRALVGLIRSGAVTLGGNGPGRIYGGLDCRAGKRMKAINRVFFRDTAEAIEAGFRPCGICLPNDYKAWKENQRYESQPDLRTA
ncbi:Ada metal-binding domain-containing protein [Spirosoma arcticum]